MNYFGTKGFLEEQLEDPGTEVWHHTNHPDGVTHALSIVNLSVCLLICLYISPSNPPPPPSHTHTDNSLLPDADYTLCLDSLSSQQSKLFLHVSKPPRESTKAFQLLQALNQVCCRAGMCAVCVCVCGGGVGGGGGGGVRVCREVGGLICLVHPCLSSAFVCVAAVALSFVLCFFVCFCQSFCECLHVIRTSPLASAVALISC